MPSGHHRPAYWKQMENFDYPQPAYASLAVQRIAEEFGGNQPEGADGFPACFGVGRSCHPYGLCRGAAPGRVCAERVGRDHAAYSGCYGAVGGGV